MIDIGRWVKVNTFDLYTYYTCCGCDTVEVVRFSIVVTIFPRFYFHNDNDMIRSICLIVWSTVTMSYFLRYWKMPSKSPWTPMGTNEPTKHDIYCNQSIPLSTHKKFIIIIITETTYGTVDKFWFYLNPREFSPDSARTNADYSAWIIETRSILWVNELSNEPQTRLLNTFHSFALHAFLGTSVYTNANACTLLAYFTLTRGITINKIMSCIMCNTHCVYMFFVY